MTFIEDVQRAKSPREALLNLAAGLDILVERIDRLERTSSWDEWGADEEGIFVPLPEPAQRAPVIAADGDTTDVNLPPPSAEKLAARRMFEKQSLHLVDYLGTGEDWTEVYAKGGPVWLYVGNRELVMSLPHSVRQALVADLEEDAPQQAKEMARDVLKESCDATGFGNSPALADEFAGGVTGIRGTG
jgi:hypothetical protein